MNGKAALSFNEIWPSYDWHPDYIEKEHPGWEIEFFETNLLNEKSVIYPRSATTDMFAVTRNADHADRALMFLNLVATDKELYQLLRYGLEGKNYELTADGKIDTSNIDAATEAFNYFPANPLKNEEFELIPADRWDEWDEHNNVFKDRAKPNLLAGFALDTSTMEAAYTALNQVRIEYGLPMQAGLVDDVDTFLSCANGTDGSDWSQYDFWNAIPDNGRLMKCEGYLFPDTYNLYADESVYYYVNQLYGEFDAKTADLADTIAAKGTSLDDVVKLASFIQEEAGLASEDPKVSACFHNRLESSDPQWAEHKLESNASSYIMQDRENNYLWNSPTAEYFGWPEQGAIPEDVLALYDTYAISGLPAGPISCPGYAAIEAALNPDQQYLDEGYYFFVTGHPDTDVAGQYFYAKTADEHYQNCVKAGWAS